MKTIVTTFLILFLALPAAGQITLDESTLQNLIGKRLTQVESSADDTTGLAALLSISGTNQTFNITGFNWMIEDTVAIDFYTFGTGTIGEDDPDFAGANLVQVPSILSDTSDFESATYSSFNSTGLFQIGAYFVGDLDDDMMPDTVKSLYQPEELDISFPFTYQTMVEDSVVHISTVSGEGTTVDTVAKSGVVDGWGTLVTPDGNFDVLRYNYEERNYFFGFVFVSQHYEYWGETGPLFSVTISDSPFGGEIVDLRYSRQTVSDPSSIDNPDFDVPLTFALQQNYPNPFNPSTTIPFELKEPALVKLSVYDILGRHIDTLLENHMPVGTHEVSWSAEDLTGGVYFATIEVGGKKQTRTMTLLK